MAVCESCERHPVGVIEACDDAAAPYRVCRPCHRRLLARALRPLEWYNLAKRHGWYRFLLHDDFYDQDGLADQFEIDLEEPERYPAPTLAQVKDDPLALLDFSITRWRFDEALTQAWHAQAKEAVLAALEARFAATGNAGIRACLLEICVAHLAGHGATFVRAAWACGPDLLPLASLARASASCLPFLEGYQRVASAIEAIDPARRYRYLACLGYFRTPEALDWLERHIVEPVAEPWGALAAASNIDWSRLRQWLKAGRPLSLVALDALREIQRSHLQPFQPPAKSELVQALEACAAGDAAPRVRQRIGAIVEAYDRLK